MKAKYWLSLAAILVLAAIYGGDYYFHRYPIAVLDPKGTIGQQERNLIVFALLLILVVVIPVFLMTIGIAWRYRASNQKARYSPELDGNSLAEAAWWLIPSAIISVLAVAAWQSSHSLDPYKPIASATPTMTVQVVAMDWKWLFIYPQQGVASVNLVDMPINTPVDFQITSDAPMNSFWIPQLGGQIYAMAGMNTHLHLEASQTGTFAGSSANISGRGFAGMAFAAKAQSEAGFQNWVAQAKRANNPLTISSYNQLAKPSSYNSVAFYSSAEPDLYQNILDRFMMPGMENFVQ